MDNKSNRKRSVVLLHNSYYHFFYLAKALRERGWDAISVSLEDPINGPWSLYYHGEDLNLFSPDKNIFRRNIKNFFNTAKDRFDLMHFAGDGFLSFFPEYFYKTEPPDIIEWLSLGKKIAYLPSGCNSGTSQSSVRRWSALGGKIVCDSCKWKNNPGVCSDEKNLTWGAILNKYCDVIFSDTLPVLDYMDSQKAVPGYYATCVNQYLWDPEIEIPDDFRIEKAGEEILIYHAVGHFNIRTSGEINIKGTHAIIKAIEELRNEGYKCRLIFKTDIPNIQLRYIQTQADIVVDELNVGRFGATSRESMMLGKPTVCYLNKNEINHNYNYSILKDVPIISATEETVYDVLKDLLTNEKKRIEIGKKSREYALKWFTPESCARRYEKIYDLLFSNDKKDLREESLRIINEEMEGNTIIVESLNIQGASSDDQSKNNLPDVKDSMITDTYLKKTWGKYLDIAWITKKEPNYIKRKEEEGRCKFDEFFEEALAEIKFGQNSNALQFLEKAKVHFNFRSEQYKFIKFEDFLFLLSQIAFKSENFEKHLEYLSAALEINSEFTEVLVSFAEMYKMTNRLPEAKIMFERAYLSQPANNILLEYVRDINNKLELEENHISRLNEWLQNKMKESEELISNKELLKAKKILENVEIVLPESVDCINNLAVIEIMNGNIFEAIERLNYILKNDPDNEIALENLRYIREMSQ